MSLRQRGDLVVSYRQRVIPAKEREGKLARRAEQMCPPTNESWGTTPDPR